MRKRIAMVGVVSVLLASVTLLGSPAASAATVPGTNVLYTTNADFDNGTLVNVNHTEVANQLQLNKTSGAFPFIWVALSQRCTIAKIDTTTGTILGEYRTVADGVACNESSRTTVGLDGSVWVGHRGPGGVTHVGLKELNACVDRNGNGTIDTSTGYGDVKAWPGATSVVSAAADECILHHVDTNALGLSDSRHMSIDDANNLWVGDYIGGHNFVRLNGATGAVLGAVRSFACGGYGGLIDKNGVIWSANGSGAGLLRWDPNAPDSATNPRCIQGFGVYGLAIDAAGSIFVTDLYSCIYKVSNDGNTVTPCMPHGASNAQGLAVDGNGDVWVSSSLFCGGGCTIGHLKNDLTFVGNVANPTGAGSTGISVDAEGKIWSANRSSNTATRIDPDAGLLGCGGTGCGDGTTIGAVDLTVSFPAGPDGRPLPSPYNYSDMTGAQLLNSTAPQGTWTVTQDAGSAGAQWGTVTWNTEPQGSVPAGAGILVEARAADTEAALGSQVFVAVSNGTAFNLTGRFIQVRVTLTPSAAGASPVLSDIRIQTAQGGDSVRASCLLTKKTAAGIEVTVQDTGSGLQSIVVTKNVNTNTTVPAFAPGSTSPVVVTSNKVNGAQASQLEMRVTDVAGNVTICDPIITTVKAGTLPQIFSGIPDVDDTVTVTNGSPGLQTVIVVLNAKPIVISNLKAGEVRTVDVGPALKLGWANTVAITGTGSLGSSAEVMIWDGNA